MRRVAPRRGVCVVLLFFLLGLVKPNQLWQQPIKQFPTDSQPLSINALVAPSPYRALLVMWQYAVNYSEATLAQQMPPLHTSHR